MARKETRRREGTLLGDRPPLEAEPVAEVPFRPASFPRFPPGLESQEMAPPTKEEPPMKKARKEAPPTPPAEAEWPPASEPREEATWAASSGAEGRQERLHREIDNLYAQVQIDVGVNRRLTEECLELLKEAREELSLADPQGLAQAEFNIETVRARLKRVRESDALAGRYGGRVLVWEGFWFIAFVMVLLNCRRLAEYLHLAESPEALVLISSLAWGGIGGALAGFYSLPWQIARREYDGRGNLLYYVQPAMGLALGGMTFLLVNAALTALLGQAGTSFSSPASEGHASLIPHLIYLLACLAGFKQDFVYYLLDRALSAITSAPPQH